MQRTASLDTSKADNSPQEISPQRRLHDTYPLPLDTLRKNVVARSEIVAESSDYSRDKQVPTNVWVDWVGHSNGF